VGGAMKRKKTRKRASSAGVRGFANKKKAIVKRKRYELFGFMAGKMKIVGDIESPIPDWSQWRPAKNLKK
jgi:hypothetical protein